MALGKEPNEDTDTVKTIKLLNGMTCTLYQCKAEHCAQYLGRVKIGIALLLFTLPMFDTTPMLHPARIPAMRWIMIHNPFFHY